MDSWKATFSFAERMGTTMKIMSAYKSAFPDLTAIELQARAKSTEDGAYNKATSRDEYHLLWKEKVSTTTGASKSTTPTTPTTPTTGDHRADEAASIPTQQIGPYRAKHHASGVTSTVYRSTSPANHTPIAIKLTTPHTLSPPHDPRREARLLRRASPHPAIVPLLATESLAGGIQLLIFPFLAYDFASLLAWRGHNKNNNNNNSSPYYSSNNNKSSGGRSGAGGGILTPSQTASHLAALFSGLAHLHAHGIIHRDVKPANLLLASPSGPAYLADFGIAWAADDPDPPQPQSQPPPQEGEEKDGARGGGKAEAAEEDKITDVGTTCYRPPELLFGYGGYGAALDMWAAGCVVAEALRGGESLFDAGDLGSELALLRSIFQTLGTPDEAVWPEAKQFRDWGKMQFTAYPKKDWADVLPGADARGRDLVASLVRYQSTHRMSADEAMKHPFFADAGT